MKRAEILNRLGEVAARTFNCPRGTIKEDTVAVDVQGWDSLSHTIFIMEIENSFGIEFDVDKVFSFNTVGDLVSALEEKKV